MALARWQGQIGWGVSAVNSKKIDFSAKGFSFIEKTGDKTIKN
jgi:hypothetical protein